MTKIHQTIIRGKPKELLEKLPREKGEFVVIIGGEDWTGIH
jgi:16S rRNA C1402 (ribose-2'-O) methylase RsmI